MAKELWVCDGCMNYVEADEIELWADFEHVLCKSCYVRDVPPTS